MELEAGRFLWKQNTFCICEGDEELIFYLLFISQISSFEVLRSEAMASSLRENYVWNGLNVEKTVSEKTSVQSFPVLKSNPMSAGQHTFYYI